MTTSINIHGKMLKSWAVLMVLKKVFKSFQLIGLKQ